MGGELRVRISEDDADSERLAELARYLRSELLELDVEDVSALSGGSEPPPGSRAFGVAEISGLLVMLGQSAAGLRSVVAAVTAWAGRGQGTRRTVRLELDGDALELSQASAADQERLISLFVSRHSEPGTDG
jgi:hypothetical protein